MPPWILSGTGMDPAITPIHGIGNGGGGFTAAPFEMANAHAIYNGAAHINFQFLFQGSQSRLSTQDAAPFVTTPQQFGVEYPANFNILNPGYFLQFFSDDGPGEGLNAVDSFWPLLGVKQDAGGTYSVGMTRPGAGTTKEVLFTMRGYDTDATTVLAEAQYRLTYNRP